MQRRDPATLVPSSADCFDPLARFFELEAAFGGDEGGLFGDPVPQRYAIANLLLCPGEPVAIEAAVRAAHLELEQHIAGSDGADKAVPTALWPLVATVLVQRGDSPAAFVAELARVRALLRDAGFRRHPAYALIAILVLRIRNELAPIRADQVARMRAIYAGMKRHHWLLTGPDDLPACAFLAATTLEPEVIGERANAIYEALRTRKLARSGDPLQTASHVLALSPREPAELVERFASLVDAFEQISVRVSSSEYDEVAVLCLLPAPATRIAEMVRAYQASIRSRLHWGDRAHTVPLAANLAFVRMLGDDPELDALADAKLLLDLQTILAAGKASKG